MPIASTESLSIRAAKASRSGKTRSVTTSKSIVSSALLNGYWLTRAREYQICGDDVKRTQRRKGCAESTELIQT
jgi:hypothetical protein